MHEEVLAIVTPFVSNELSSLSDCLPTENGEVQVDNNPLCPKIKALLDSGVDPDVVAECVKNPTTSDCQTLVATDGATRLPSAISREDDHRLLIVPSPFLKVRINWKSYGRARQEAQTTKNVKTIHSVLRMTLP